MDQDHIDGLLERYLQLLHEYTSLREELSTLHTGMYQNIARANFAAERGVRFGPDYYDDRMQASRRLAISFHSQSQGQGQNHNQSQYEDQDQSQGQSRNQAILDERIPSFTIVASDSVSVSVPATVAVTAEGSEANVRVPDPNPAPEAEAEAEVESAAANAATTTTRATPTAEAQNAPASTSASDVDTGTNAESEKKTAMKSFTTTTAAAVEKPMTTANKPKDPLRWFGVLTPMPLRQAQAQSIRAVEDVIPRLVSVNAQMIEVEIEVRRARKKRTKAEAAVAKLAQPQGTQKEREPEGITAG
ncbi:hypothetical protein F5Y19DRAFT_123979 [Xylariaceae sp. FL1651]|nr:hypothetical protein F5Y19DRAFT_123979 [Xylariaceae sp. FL1651]